ncbi:MAG TPA: thiamine pyrophosphate-dependent enzyme, partial [Candidatus Berkiella sp.]|nr:thiamine pyrophosphate-dependent enzyme [Candidatus Berkiella sp.]
DGLSIGANHLMHIMRRNLDVTILLFNNQIYGLTKGQYSPTSEKGKKTKTSPQGTIDEPFNPVQLALAAGCSFVARAIDVDAVGLQWVLKEAAAHRGTSFVEIYQNCNVFNDGAFAHISDRGFRAERTISLRPNQPLVFGQAEDKGLIYDGNDFVVAPLQSPEDKAQVYVHQVENDLSMAIKLNSLSYPEFPVPIGIFRKVERPIYEEEMKAQLDASAAKQGKPSLDDLLHSGKTWTVK